MEFRRRDGDELGRDVPIERLGEVVVVHSSFLNSHCSRASSQAAIVSWEPSQLRLFGELSDSFSGMVAGLPEVADLAEIVENPWRTPVVPPNRK